MLPDVLVRILSLLNASSSFVVICDHCRMMLPVLLLRIMSCRINSPCLVGICGPCKMMILVGVNMVPVE